MMNTTDKREYLRMGAEFYAQGRLQDAYTAYDKSVQIDSNFAEGYGGRGYALQDLGDLQGALRDYSKAVELDSDYADGYLNRAILKYRLKDSSAMSDANKAKILYQAQLNYGGVQRAAGLAQHIMLTTM
jgi:tetratricopeptide (TPR) repeat protein